MLETALPYIVGAVVLAVLGFMARTFFSGLRENIVKAVVDSALKRILGTMQNDITEIKNDFKLFKAERLTEGQNDVLKAQELNDVRTRLFDHLDADNRWKDLERAFRLEVTDFMDWARGHSHPAPPLAP